MRLKKLWVKEFKNLREIKLEFDPTPNRLLSVVIGWNGTGKSNLIEALVIIFRELDLGGPPKFAYKLEYECRKRLILVDADPNRSGPKIVFKYREKIKKEKTNISELDNYGAPKKVAYSKFKSGEGREYLPKNVFGYYSGPSNRLEKHFEKHQDIFYKQLLYPEKYGIDEKELPLRPLFYARMIHSHFVLLAFFLDDDPTIINFLKDQLGIVGLDSVLFVMRSPKTWSWKNRKGGDKRFWHSKGIVQVFLDRLYEASLAPHRVTISRTEELLYLFIKDKSALKNLAEDLTNSDFFKELESTYISDLIEEVRIRVKLQGKEETLTFHELSEGEQQLLTVLGLIRFTSESESLFLLDEPDTHLNPAWGMKYIEFLGSVAGLNNDKKNHLNSQVILTTHDPIVLASLYKEQIQLMKRDESSREVVSGFPEYDPIGMGYTGILTSDMFGFRSDLDQLTLSYLDERAILSGKDKLSLEESDRLEELNQELDKSGFLEAYSDPYFSAFVKAWARRNKVEKYNKPFLSGSDLKNLEKMTDEILDELESEDKIKK